MNSGSGGKDDNTLDVGTELQGTLEDTGSAVDGRVNELVGMRDVEMEGGSGVLDGIDTLDSLVEGVFLMKVGTRSASGW